MLVVKVWQDPLDRSVLLEDQENVGQLAHQELLVKLGQQDPLVKQVPQEETANQERMDFEEILEM